MRYTAAYLLAVLGGNPSPDVAAIAKILGSVGIECDEARAQKVVDACKGKNVDEIIAKGMTTIDTSLANTSAVTTTVTNDKSHVDENVTVPAVEEPPPSPPGSPTGGDFFSLFD